MPEGISDERKRLIRIYMDGERADGSPDLGQRRALKPDVSPARRDVSRPAGPRLPESTPEPPAATGSAILGRRQPRRRHPARPPRLTAHGGWALAMITVATFVGWLVAHA